MTSLVRPLLPAMLGVVFLPLAATASDHKEAPIIAEDPTADIADLYVFNSPSTPGNIVLALTVNPFSVPSEGPNFQFSPHVRYNFLVDNDGDAIEDESITVWFRNGRMRAQLSNGLFLIGGVTDPTFGTTPNAPIINTDPSGVTTFAGPRDDPFFFDVVGFNRFLGGTGGFTGTDGFAGFNCSAIVVELPAAMLSGGNDQLQIWATTERRRNTVRRASTGQLQIHGGAFEQVDRVGNPAINTALLPAQKKDFFNIGLPQNDGTDFAADIVASLTALGTDSTNIGILASVAVPDTLKVNLSQPLSFPNGRRLDDDVVDTLFFFIFNQTVVPDGVPANDAPFQVGFPYLAEPFQP